MSVAVELKVNSSKEQFGVSCMGYRCPHGKKRRAYPMMVYEAIKLGVGECSSVLLMSSTEN